MKKKKKRKVKGIVQPKILNINSVITVPNLYDILGTQKENFFKTVSAVFSHTMKVE